MDRTNRIARAHELPGAPPAEQMSGNRAALLGWRIVEALDGRSRMEWTPTPELANPVGQVHGGYLGLIVDDVCGTAFASLLTEFVLFPTLSMHLEFHRPIQIGETVQCRGTVVRIGRRFVVVDAVIRGSEGTLRARGTATFAADTEELTMADGRPLRGFSALDDDE
jgi:uncharacterized protein (TIGR00369 family)